MSHKEPTEAALNSAFEIQVKALFDRYVQAVIAANGDRDAELAAGRRFESGLALVQMVYRRARALAGLPDH